MELLTSAQNPKIKQLLALQEKSGLRHETGLFVVEGARELEHCLASGFEADTVFVCPEIMDEHEALRFGVSGGRDEVWKGKRPRMVEVSRELYSKIAYRGGTEGIMAEIKTRFLKLSDLHLPDNPLIAVLEGVEKPGNVGAVLRSCDAAGADALILCDPRCDLYNPNLIRSSIGAVFTVPCVACGSEEAIAWLKASGIQILTAQLQDSERYYDSGMEQGTAIVLGTESTGLTEMWREAADAHIRIPMAGQLDSLNVSVSAAILLFEAVRQRQTND